jgi:hypothetical protein
MKVGLASILSCLVLLVAMFATTGTASASSASTARHVDPDIHVAFVIRAGTDCTSFLLVGHGFSSNSHARLFAQRLFGFGVFITPHSVRTNSRGEFSTGATVCSGANFENCGEFIENPFSFCGFGLNPQEFCQFSSEGSFCFNGVFSQNQFTPISVAEFCRFHTNSFCIFRHSQLVLITAVDSHTGIESNTVAVRIRFGFF